MNEEQSKIQFNPNYHVIGVIPFQQGRKSPHGLYNGRKLEIRQMGKQVRFYETNGKKEYCLKKETVKWLVRTGALPKKEMLTKYLK